MDSRRAQFLIMVGEVGQSALLANLPVGLEMNDGSTHCGTLVVRRTGSGDEVDHTGYKQTARIDDALVELEDVAAVSVRYPADAPV